MKTQIKIGFLYLMSFLLAVVIVFVIDDELLKVFSHREMKLLNGVLIATIVMLINYARDKIKKRIEC